MSNSTDDDGVPELDFSGIDDLVKDIDEDVDEGNNDSDDGEGGEMPDVDDDPRFGSEEERRVELADGTLVGRRKGMDGDGFTYRCVEDGCLFESESEQGVKTHYGSQHKGDDGETVNDEDDGAGESTGTLLGAESVESRGRVGTDDGGDGDEIDNDDGDDEDDGLGEVEYDDEEGTRPAEWESALQAYIESSEQQTPTRKSDAREATVSALEEDTEWMCIVDRSDAGNTYDLWRWSDADGWRNDAMAYLAEEVTRYLGAEITDTEINHIASLLARYNFVSQDETNAQHLDETLIPVGNGVICVEDIEYDEDSMEIDWESVALRDKDPEHRLLYQIDTEWDPDAADVDGLDEWLETITESDEDRRIIWEFAGHACHPRYPTDGFLTALGRGGSGKSQTLEVIKAMLGDNNVSVAKLQRINTGRFTGQEVVDKRANINTELSGTKIENIDKLKVYSAGEEDMVEGKGQPFYKAQNDATMLFASDNPPAIAQDNRALGRRLYPVEFPYVYVDDPDPDRAYELQARPKPEVQAELQADGRLKAALMRAVGGLTRLVEEGDFTSSLDWQERVERYQSYSDPIRDFARTALTADPDGAIESGDLEMTFDAFAAEKGHDGKKLQQIWSVLQNMPSHPTSKSRTRTWTSDDSRHTVYRGVSFNQHALEHWVPDSAHWEQYGGRPECRGGGPGDESRRARIAELSTGRVQDRGIKVEVSHSGEPKPWLADEGVLQDGAGTIRYESRDEIQLKEGETYVIEDFRVVPDEGESDLIVDLVAGMTDIYHVAADDGEDDGDSGSDDGDGEGDEIVNGDDDAHHMIKQVVEATKIRAAAIENPKKEWVVPHAASKLGVDESTVERHIEQMKKDGKLYEPKEDRYKLVGDVDVDDDDEIVNDIDIDAGDDTDGGEGVAD